MNVLSRLLDHSTVLISKKIEIQAGLPEFYNEHSKVFNLRGQTRTDVMVREIEFDRYIRGFLAIAE
jgi:hypothetical protein